MNHASPHASPYASQIPLDVSRLFEKLTLDLWTAGWEHYSADAILHRIRWHHHVTLNDREFKCNNNWTAPLARWCMRRNPQIGDFFRTRIMSSQPPLHEAADGGHV